jgi:hypothetical protein
MGRRKEDRGGLEGCYVRAKRVVKTKCFGIGSVHRAGVDVRGS